MRVAIVYQGNPPPKSQNGLIKPFKPTGYRDSSADLGFQLYMSFSKEPKYPLLQFSSYELITNQKFYNPNQSIHQQEESFFCFPDTEQGIQEALSLGANFFWCNTVLFSGHILEKYLQKLNGFVGNYPHVAARFDDKAYTNKFLSQYVQVPNHILISIEGNHQNTLPCEYVTQQTAEWKKELYKNFPTGFPLVLKPVLGRGSQGVQICYTENELVALLRDSKQMSYYLQTFGEILMLEEYLPGEEITVAVFPPGIYCINNEKIQKSKHWALPPVVRTNHMNGIAPYNGTVPVVQNSKVISSDILALPCIQRVLEECETAAKLIGCTSVCRIDCRSTHAQLDDSNNIFKLFDTNLKPNITGSGREGRESQDSLVNIAATSIGWLYRDVVLNMLCNGVIVNKHY